MIPSTSAGDLFWLILALASTRVSRTSIPTMARSIRATKSSDSWSTA